MSVQIKSNIYGRQYYKTLQEIKLDESIYEISYIDIDGYNHRWIATYDYDIYYDKIHKINKVWSDEPLIIIGMNNKDILTNDEFIEKINEKGYAFTVMNNGRFIYS
jgi:hypothetical protein